LDSAIIHLFQSAPLQGRPATWTVSGACYVAAVYRVSE